MYLGGLFIPFFIDIPNAQFFQPIAIVVLLLWGFSVYRLVKKEVFFIRPSGDGNYLRDIVYLPLKEK